MDKKRIKRQFIPEDKPFAVGESGKSRTGFSCLDFHKIGKCQYLKKKLVGCSSYALVIKLCDRLANISDNPTEKMLQDTRDIISFVKENRKLTKTHLKIIDKIEEILNSKVEDIEDEPDSCIDNCL